MFIYQWFYATVLLILQCGTGKGLWRPWLVVLTSKLQVVMIPIIVCKYVKIYMYMYIFTISAWYLSPVSR